MAYRHRRILSLTAIILLLACTACAPASDIPGEDAPIPVSADAAARLDAKLAGLPAGGFQLQIDQQEATSYAALRLGNQFPLASPQVRFLPGEIVLEGDLTAPIRARMRLAGTLQIVAGQIEISVQQASIGRVAIPRFLLASISDSLTEMANDSRGSIDIQKIEIRSGQIQISGRTR